MYNTVEPTSQPNIQHAKTRREKILAIAAEWSKGCTNTTIFNLPPWDFEECTDAMMGAIERACRPRLVNWILRQISRIKKESWNR